MSEDFADVRQVLAGIPGLRAEGAITRLGGLTIRGRKRRSLARFLAVLAPFVAFAALTWALYGPTVLEWLP